VPQVHAPGAEAEVDFADVWVQLAVSAVSSVHAYAADVVDDLNVLFSTAPTDQPPPLAPAGSP
jgi:hypothetical protein